MPHPSAFNSHLSNTTWLVGGRLVKALLNFAVSIAVARYLGPEKFGILNYAIGLTMFFSIFCSMGIEGILVRELVSGTNKQRNALLGSAFLIRIIGSGLALAFTVALLCLTNADYETWVLTLACALSFLFMPTDIFRSFYEATVRGKYIALTETIQTLLSAGLRIYFITVKGDVFWFAICWVTEWAFTGIGLACIYRIRDGRLLDWRAQRSTITHLVKESAPLLFSAMVWMVYEQIDKIMLKNMLSDNADSEIGHYSAALRVLPFVILIPLMMGKALSPSLMRAKNEDPDTYPIKTQSFLDLITWSGIGLSILLYLFARPIISVYGSQYADATVLLRIVAWKGLFLAMSMSSGWWIITEGLQRWAALRNLSGCLVNIALNCYLIPRYGAQGAAWATVVSLAIAAFLIHPFIPAYRPLFRLQTRAVLEGWLRLCKIAYTQLRLRTGQ